MVPILKNLGPHSMWEQWTLFAMQRSVTLAHRIRFAGSAHCIPEERNLALLAVLENGIYCLQVLIQEIVHNVCGGRHLHHQEELLSSKSEVDNDQSCAEWS